MRPHNARKLAWLHRFKEKARSISLVLLNETPVSEYWSEVIGEYAAVQRNNVPLLRSFEKLLTVVSWSKETVNEWAESDVNRESEVGTWNDLEREIEQCIWQWRRRGSDRIWRRRWCEKRRFRELGQNN